MAKRQPLGGIMRKTFSDMCNSASDYDLRLFEDVLLNEKNKRVKIKI